MLDCRAQKTRIAKELHIYCHKYEVGDIAIWDTLQTMHSAVPSDTGTSEADSRLLWRLSILGKPLNYFATAVQ